MQFFLVPCRSHGRSSVLITSGDWPTSQVPHLVRLSLKQNCFW
jgi:hypothetical protein